MDIYPKEDLVDVVCAMGWVVRRWLSVCWRGLEPTSYSVTGLMSLQSCSGEKGQRLLESYWSSVHTEACRSWTVGWRDGSVVESRNCLLFQRT